MPEQQNLEYKSTWRDEYLRWICGFANAQGGTLYIGKDDSGSTAYYIGSQWMDAVAYIILILYLIARPLGFSGKRLKKIEI